MRSSFLRLPKWIIEAHYELAYIIGRVSECGAHQETCPVDPSLRVALCVLDQELCFLFYAERRAASRSGVQFGDSIALNRFLRV
jgi:hypothetical protein